MRLCYSRLDVDPEEEGGGEHLNENGVILAQQRPKRRLSATMTEAERSQSYVGVLPEYARDPEVQKLADTEFKDKLVPMGLCSGPAVKWARWAVAAMWLSLPVVGCTALKFSRCTTKGERMAVVPVWCWVFWIPSFIFSFFVEVKCLRWTSIPYIQVVSHYRLFGTKVSFNTWLMVTLFISSLQRVDLATDGFFTATVVANPYCKGEGFDKVWKIVMQQSALHRFHLEDHIAFDAIAVFSFFVMFCQVLYAILMTTPRCGSSVDYVIGTKRADGEKANVQFTNMVGEHMNLGDALHILGEPIGMMAITKQKPIFPQKKASLLLKGDVTEDCRKRALSFAKNTLTQGIALLGCVAFLENSIQINLQVSYFAMRRAVSHDSLWQWHWMSGLASIFLSLIMSGEKMVVAWEFIKFADKVIQKIDALPQEEAPAEEEENPDMGRARSEFHHADNWSQEREVAIIRRYNTILKFFTGLLVLLVVYAMCKCVAIFACKDSLLNLTGCVDLGELSHAGRHK